MFKTCTSLLISKVKVLAVAGLFVPFAVAAQSATLVEFDATPVSDIDDSGKFYGCGYEFRSQLTNANLNSAVRLFVQRDKAHKYFVTVEFLERDNSKSKWTPRSNVVQWVRVNTMEPLRLDAYNLVTTPDLGVSRFARQMTSSYDLLKEVEAEDSTLWVSILDKTTGDIKAFSGSISMPKNVAVVGRQCQKNLALAKN